MRRSKCKDAMAVVAAALVFVIPAGAQPKTQKPSAAPYALIFGTVYGYR